jgi:hypothetical protein
MYDVCPRSIAGEKDSGPRVCFEQLRILNFAPDFSVCCGACLHIIGAEASTD